jgi:hypothetical protein
MQDIQTHEPVRGFNMIKELSSSLVAIVCGAIWLSAIDRVDATGKEKDEQLVANGLAGIQLRTGGVRCRKPEQAYALAFRLRKGDS